MISLKLAKRELLNNSRYWLIFTLNLSLGLLGFVLIFLFRESIGISLEQRAKTLLSSDIAISGRRELVDLEQKTIDRYLMDKVSSHTDLVEMYSMGMAEKASGAVSRLTFIKAIQGVFPLIGEIRLKDGRELTQQIIKSLQAKPVVIISSEVSHQFKLEQGDFIQLGKTKFNVLGILAKDTTSAMRGVSFAPKVYIGLKQLAATGLTGHGSIAWFTDFYLLNKNIDHKSTLDDLKKMVKDPAISVRGPKDSGQQLGRVLNYLTDYLGLVGLVAVLISSIGAFYLFQSYLLSRIKYMGILKTLGLSKQTIAMSFIWIIIFLGMLASSLSLFLVKLFLPIVFSVLTQWMDISYQVVLTYSMLFTLFSISILINAFVCVPLIISVLKKPTIELLQNNLKIKFGLVDLIYYVPAFLFLWSLAIWQAHSVKIGSIFIFAIVGIFIVVFSLFPFGFNYISNKLLKLELKQPFSLSFGLALRYFIRNKVASMLSVLCLAIGILLMTVIAQISASLEVELTDNRLAKPSLFLFDIQDDQSVALVDFAKKNDIPLMQTTPMVRARLIKKMGK
ncbi:MAG: FtsX-like permease family protein, partial [Halobacteriovoraceae bacterium]|nr:FtsX-like permease family protein [Halobacteriovoraceae bacterium]